MIIILEIPWTDRALAQNIKEAYGDVEKGA
jgi:hypothetical protein